MTELSILRPILVLLVGGAAALWSGPVHGQTPGSPPSPADGPTVRWHLAGLLGTPASFSGHAIGGLEGTILRGRWGGSGTIQLGFGSEYGSLFVGAGPGGELASAGNVQILGWAGPAWFRETLDAGPSRSTLVGTITIGVRRPVSLGAVSLRVTWLGGRLEGEDFVTSAPISGFRLSVGVGR